VTVMHSFTGVPLRSSDIDRPEPLMLVGQEFWGTISSGVTWCRRFLRLMRDGCLQRGRQWKARSTAVWRRSVNQRRIGQPVVRDGNWVNREDQCE
jgi:hypothetical protein